MQIRIKISFDKDFIYSNPEVGSSNIEWDKIIGFFSSIDDAEKAIEEVLKEELGCYKLEETLVHPYDDIDITKIFNTEEEEKGYYSIQIHYSLALI